MNKKQMSLEVVKPNAGGIDVGSKSHWVAIGQDAQYIREFGVYSQNHQELCNRLFDNGIESIAMENTGTYWQNQFNLYKGAGLGLSHSMLQIGALRPKNYDEEFKNTFYLGASTVPGAGLPMAVMSSKLTTERVLDYKG